MAGTIKSAARGAGESVLRMVKLLFLAFWIGGGLATAGLTSASFWKNYPEQGPKMTGEILRWFSVMELVVGAVLCAILFFFEVRRRKGYVTLAAVAVMVLTTLINQIAITDQSVYVSLFLLTIGIALISFVAIALSGIPYQPVPQGEAKPPEPISPPSPIPVRAPPPPPAVPSEPSPPAQDRAELLGEKSQPEEGEAKGKETE